MCYLQANYPIVFILCVKHASFTWKYNHSNIAIRIWHPLSDESSFTPMKLQKLPKDTHVSSFNAEQPLHLSLLCIKIDLGI